MAHGTSSHRTHLKVYLDMIGACGGEGAIISTVCRKTCLSYRDGRRKVNYLMDRNLIAEVKTEKRTVYKVTHEGYAFYKYVTENPILMEFIEMLDK